MANGREETEKIRVGLELDSFHSVFIRSTMFKPDVWEYSFQHGILTPNRIGKEQSCGPAHLALAG
jgi:hypothetical protein